MNMNDVIGRISNYLLDIISYDIISNNITDAIDMVNDSKFNMAVNDTNNKITANIITVKFTDVNIGISVGKVSNFTFDISMIYLLTDNTISNISISIENIKSIDTYDIYVNDIISSLLSSTFSNIFQLYTNGIVDVDNNNKAIELVDDIEIDIKLNNSESKTISIMAMFLNIGPIKYNVSLSDDAILTISTISSSLGDAIKEFIGNNNKLIDDISELEKYYDIDVTEFDKIFVTNNDDSMIRKIAISTIHRSGQSSIVDILTALDGYGVVLNNIDFIIKLEV